MKPGSLPDIGHIRLNACAPADIGNNILKGTVASQAAVLVGFPHEPPEFCIGNPDRRGHLRIYPVVFLARETPDQCAKQVEDDSAKTAFLLLRVV